MMKVRCRCGHAVVAETEDLPFQGYLLSDTDTEPFWDGLVHEAMVQARAHEAGDRRQVVLDRMLPDAGEVDAGADQGGHSRAVAHLRAVYQCDACGRLLVETAPQTGDYRSFLPEDEDPIVVASSDLPPPVI